MSAQAVKKVCLLHFRMYMTNTIFPSFPSLMYLFDDHQYCVLFYENGWALKVSTVFVSANLLLIAL